jgi:hypothetical protein
MSALPEPLCHPFFLIPSVDNSRWHGYHAATMNIIKLTIRGYPLEVSNPADAFELIRLDEESQRKSVKTKDVTVIELGKGNAPPKAEVPPEPPKPSTTDPVILKTASEFLRVVQGAGPTGVLTERIIQALGVPHGRAIGGKLALVNKHLESIGFHRRDEIYSNKKTANGRIWKPRKSIDAALSVTDQQLRALQ